MSDNYERKYHDLMDALKRSVMPHGDCASGKRYGGLPKACTACMAKLYIEKELDAYKGRTIYPYGKWPLERHEIEVIDGER